MTPSEVRRWRAWRLSADKALREQRARDLSAMTAEEARAASDMLLRLTPFPALPERRRRSSGLVLQQAAFHHGRPQSSLSRRS